MHTLQSNMYLTVYMDLQGFTNDTVLCTGSLHSYQLCYMSSSLFCHRLHTYADMIETAIYTTIDETQVSKADVKAANALVRRLLARECRRFWWPRTAGGKGRRHA